MVIFAIGVLAVINMQLASSQYNVKSRNMTEGIVVAQGKVEEIRGMDYSDADLNDTDGLASLSAGVASTIGKTIDEELAEAEHQEAADPRFRLGWNVRDDYPYEDTKTIRVIVKWQERGLKQTFSMDTVKADGD
jgi:Tfp pilus assembly protein PilV